MLLYPMRKKVIRKQWLYRGNNMKYNKLILLASVVFLLSTGCAALGSLDNITEFYTDVEVGEFHGRLLVEWVGPDTFLFTPDNEDPFYFMRSNGEKIEPGLMYTDGGSVPRPLWAFKNYSPWGYAPAFIIHDWVYKIKRCNLDGPRYGFLESATVMAEGLKTLMESAEYGGIDKLVLLSMYNAVTGSSAEESYDSSCKLISSETITTARILSPYSYVIEFK